MIVVTVEVMSNTNEMKFDENIKKSLNLANNATAVTDATFKGLLENCFSVLTGLPEPHSTFLSSVNSKITSLFQTLQIYTTRNRT